MIEDKTSLTKVTPLDLSTPNKKVNGYEILNAPQKALTAANATAFVSNASGSVADSGIVTLDNMRTRIGELEARLKALNLLL